MSQLCLVTVKCHLDCIPWYLVMIPESVNATLLIRVIQGRSSGSRLALSKSSLVRKSNVLNNLQLINFVIYAGLVHGHLTVLAAQCDINIWFPFVTDLQKQTSRRICYKIN